MKYTIRLECEEYDLLLGAIRWDANRLKSLAQDVSDIDMRRNILALAEREMALRSKIINTSEVED